MFCDRFVKKEDSQVDKVLEQTKSSELKWQNTGFVEPSWACWKINFFADDGQRELVLEKESTLTNGGWVTQDCSLLRIKDKNTEQESTHTYREDNDYKECLLASGYPGVSSLARFVIDRFRLSMNLHWSVM